MILFSSDVSCLASGVFVKEGAIALTRILGASSAARDFVSPSMAPFAIAMDAWKFNPVWAAKEENSVMVAFPDFLREGRDFWMVVAAPSVFSRKSVRKSSSVNRWKGFKVMEPGQYMRLSRVSGSSSSVEFSTSYV